MEKEHSLTLGAAYAVQNYLGNTLPPPCTIRIDLIGLSIIQVIEKLFTSNKLQDILINATEQIDFLLENGILSCSFAVDGRCNRAMLFDNITEEPGKTMFAIE